MTRSRTALIVSITAALPAGAGALLFLAPSRRRRVSGFLVARWRSC